jgi:hypothetical protein
VDVQGSAWGSAVQVSALDPTGYVGGFTAAELEVRSVATIPMTLDLSGSIFASTDSFGSNWNPRSGIADYDLDIESYDLANIAGSPYVVIENAAGLSYCRLR